MALRQRLAVTLPAGPDAESTLARVHWAEEVGYDDGWFSDGNAPDALTLCGAVAMVTKRLRFGIAVTPVYSRTPAVLAATANAIGQLMPGRFVMGLGSSSEAMMSGWNGVAFEKPLTRVRETVVMVRSMLTGEKSKFDLETLRSHGYVQPPLALPVPIYVAGLRGKMLEMAASLGDGVILNLWPKNALPKMMEHIRIGAKMAGKGEVEVVNRHHVLVTQDRVGARNRMRAHFAPYYATSVYNRFLAWAGYEAEAAAIREGWAAKDRTKTMAALSDSLIDDIAIIGSAEECRERVRWSAKTGIHTHIIAPIGGSTPQEVQDTLDAFVPAKMKL